jgi:UDP-N-acetylmuramate dehydrogenase
MAIKVQQNVSLGQYTTLQVGGVSDYVIEVDSVTALQEACEFASTHTKLPPLVLGLGSNVLIGDEGYRGAVLLMRIQGVREVIDDDGIQLTAMAGEDWDGLVLYTTKNGWWGLENLSGIPGTVGASPIQNINAYGASVSDSIVSVSVYDVVQNKIYSLSKEACRFGYRDSIFKHADMKHCVVVSVTFVLQKTIVKNISYKSSSQSIEKIMAEKNILTPTAPDVREAVLQARGTIGMLEGMFRSAGSFFKNTIVTNEQFTKVLAKVETDFPELNDKFSPWYWRLDDQSVKLSTAFLLECSPYNKSTFGIKRHRGVVGLSPKHSLSIVTEAGATAADVKDFVEIIILSVKNIFAVTIESEVIHL